MEINFANSYRIMELLLMAKLLPIAFPPIVREAITAATIKPVINKLK